MAFTIRRSMLVGGESNTASGESSSVPGGDNIVCNPTMHAVCGEGAIVPSD